MESSPRKRPSLWHPRWWVYTPCWPNPDFNPSWDNAMRGIWAERVAARYLWKQGFRILGTRWTAASRSDIDLIAAHENYLLFVEVKCRPVHDTEAEAMIFDEKRIVHLRDSIAEYLRQTNQQQTSLRVDGMIVRPGVGSISAPFVDVIPDYIPPTTIPGWRGIVSAGSIG